MAVNRFDRPIPGQSLTEPPRNAKHEKPPQFTNKDKALEFLMQSLFQANQMAKVVTMIDGGANVEQLCRVILFGGFMEGKWSMDLCVLMSQPLAAMISVIYYNLTGKKPAMTSDEGQPDPGLVQALQATASAKAAEPTPSQVKLVEEKVKSSGIMGAR